MENSKGRAHRVRKRPPQHDQLSLPYLPDVNAFFERWRALQLQHQHAGDAVQTYDEKRQADREEERLGTQHGWRVPVKADHLCGSDFRVHQLLEQG